MLSGTGFQLVRRPLGWELAPADVLRLVRGDSHPVALFGDWAGGGDVVAAEPLVVRSAPAGFDDVLDAPFPTGADGSAGPSGDQAGAFGGGWIGYLGYSAGGEALPATGPRALPAWWFGYYDHVLRRERATGEWYFEALWTDERAEALEDRFAELASRPGPGGGAPAAAAYRFSPFRLAPGADGHQDAVRKAVEYIHQGDIFQANITLRAEAEFAGDPLDAFCQGASALQPPYSAFISVSDSTDGSDGRVPAAPRAAVASLSPELFLRRAGGTVTSKPIKGTARRSGDAAAAAAQRAELEASAKNRAENVMIVDLVRNDLSRVCVPGTVTVPVLLGPEPHPGIWHLVSTVTGTLNPGAGDGELVRATFPPGSVTGAPKVRALEIIDELETGPREAYTGGIGYRSPVAGLELNVAIRTFEFAAGKAWLGAGGGIVADSDPAAEFAECLIKATPLLQAIGARLDTAAPAGDSGGQAALLPRPAAGVFTSLLVSGGQTRGLAAHLARLEASVQELYGKELPASLRGELAGCLATRPTGRLRITVRPVGGPLQVTVEVVPLAASAHAAGPRASVPYQAGPHQAGSQAPASLAAGPAGAGPLAAGPGPAAVTLLPVTVPGGLGPHKYRDRRLLAELARREQPSAAEQLLLTDETGELLETDRASVFAVIDGVLLTPPADGRILPGTTRAAVLRAARARDIRVGQKPLTLDQLTVATEVFVTNAVAGVLPVTAIRGAGLAWPPGPVAADCAAALAERPLDGPLPPADPVAAAGAGPVAAPAATGAASATAQPAATVHSVATAGLSAPARPAKPGGFRGLNPISLGISGGAGASGEGGPRTAGLARGPARPLVVLIDNYDSFTWNLAHLLNNAGARVEVVRNDEVTAAQILTAAPAAVVISPGPCAPAEAGISIAAVTACAGAGVPLLGICLGHQAIGAAFGADIVAAPRPVHGQAFPVTHDGSGVLAGLPRPFQATRYHSLVIDESTLPADLVVTARTDGIPMAVRHRTLPVEGVQFHPESVLTVHGPAIIGGFVAAAERARPRR
jgi:para-aminobenzoate synthetase/4-amino-4-deoxychorismate lyase